MPRSLRIQSTAKPNSNLPSTIAFQRLSICQLCAAPLEMALITFSMSRPERWPRFSASARPWTMPAMHIWFIILVIWPEPGGPISVSALE